MFNNIGIDHDIVVAHNDDDELVEDYDVDADTDANADADADAAVCYGLYAFCLTEVTASKRKRKCTEKQECGARPPRREPRIQRTPKQQEVQNQQSNPYNNRTPRIIAGAPTKEGQFPWQVSLELLHPSMGFLGHWCGAVLIHPFWILSAAHCVHNDLFNLPIPPLWTVVLGEYDRYEESGYEQRIPVEKIVLHKHYHNFLHDLVLMKLSMPADLTKTSNIRRICLPFIFNDHSNVANDEDLQAEFLEDPLEFGLAEVPEKMDNFLRSVQNIRKHRNVTMPSMKELLSTKILSRLRKTQSQKSFRGLYLTRRRNDKLMKVHANDKEYEGLIEHKHNIDTEDYKDLPFIDCVATGWGKSNMTGDLTDTLLKTSVPLHSSERCKEAYGSFVKIHRGHLCAGQLNGKGGTCVGDSGGPLQCRLSKNGPWILAGITSFGSGCAIKGFPDVYTRTSYYMKWIQDTIAYE
ncbi:uncharacterized protein LOC119676812 [Teleopsis dalmanni]|uniref:uncharacterized protein LOC119676812 n=1 Tax=Teleopsis dalmanni TaxID=139649 RepID=UPI0018CE465F|nr:uncharacterized protein LOC119676812 [Teleopsis dalmanni]